MRKSILTAIAAIATLGAVAAGPKQAEASSPVAPATSLSAPVEMQFYYGGGYRRYHRPYYGYRRYAPPAYFAPPYYGPRCFVKRRWVETPYGLQLRNVRICR